jgi:hypothetical protein
MQLNAEDYAAIWLTLKLAGVTTVLLCCCARRWPGGWPIPARAGAARLVPVALPLVLPPTVIGFYLLVTMGKRPIGSSRRPWAWAIAVHLCRPRGRLADLLHAVHRAAAAARSKPWARAPWRRRPAWAPVRWTAF